MLFDYYIKPFIKLYVHRIRWKKNNPNNYTIPLNEFNQKNVLVGDFSYGGLRVEDYNDISKLSIGRFCSIGPEVLFILNSEHYLSHVSTFPFKAMILHDANGEAISKGNIVVDDEVWFGAKSIIMSGVHIGQGAVIAAGAVVTKDVPPYAIVGGVPAKVIKYRFEPEMIKELLKIDYGKLSKEDIEKHIDHLYTELKNSSQLDWMPKKGESRV